MEGVDTAAPSVLLNAPIVSCSNLQVINVKAALTCDIAPSIVYIRILGDKEKTVCVFRSFIIAVTNPILYAVSNVFDLAGMLSFCFEKISNAMMSFWRLLPFLNF